MRLLLVLALILLPLSGYAADSTPLSEQGADQQTTTGPAIIGKSSGDESLIDQPWPYANPYHPTSATNFDVFAAPLFPLPEGNDRSRMSIYLSDSGPKSAIYGHFGSPFFPDSINRRGETAHPYAMDSQTNHYGRSGLMEKR